MELKLAERKLFEGMKIECYEDGSREIGDFFMTRKQIGEALEYSSESTYNRVISRNTIEIGNPTLVNLTRVEGNREVSRDIELYSFNQLFQILRFSKQPKANLFMSWASITLQELVTGRAELKFAKQEDEVSYKSKIEGLTKEVETMTNKLDSLDKTLGTLISTATINSFQAKQLNKMVRDRIRTMLGGTHTPTYKEKGRMYFKNLWLGLCDTFNVSTYLELNPLNYNNAILFIEQWKYSDVRGV